MASRFQSFVPKSDRSQCAPRLKALRQNLHSLSLDGLIVPRTDDYQGEYVAECAERLAWLSGFTGSWGMAIALTDRAALFVDGRYTEQAREQSDVSLFEQCHLIDQPPHEWLEQALPANARLGYDPTLHTEESLTRIRQSLAKIGATLVACAQNPIDQVWTDQPAPPMAAIALHPLTYAGEPSADKIKRIQDKLSAEKADALLVTDPHNLAWIFNIRGKDVSHTPLPHGRALIPTHGKPLLALAAQKLTPEIGKALALLAEVIEPDALPAAIEQMAAQHKSIRIDPATASVHYIGLIEKASGTVLRGLDPVSLMKAQKNDAEKNGTRSAHLRDGVAMTRFLHWLDQEAPKGQMTEIAAAEKLEAFRSESPLLADLSFPSISASGAHAALPHYRVSTLSNAPISEGFFLIDSGGQYQDGTTDITRTIAIGPVSDEMKDRYTRVLKGMIAIARAVFPKGTSGAQLDALARQSLWEIGCDFDHGTGHGVGCFLSVHEGPQRLSKIGTTPLETGMILSDEPGYYKAGAYGIRIENLVLVEARDFTHGERPMLGFETLTFAPIDTRPIDTSLMTESEISWLNTYHAEVEKRLSPHLDGAAKSWLQQATRPI
jgi:Xaa-Pro aminopeptidase